MREERARDACSSKKKFPIARIVSGILLILATALLVYAVAARITGTPFRIFGYSFHVVMSDSMTGEIEKGDFIIAKSRDIASVEVGDDVVFKAKSGIMKGQFIVHRAVQKTVGEDGSVVLRTQGVKPGAPVDSDPVTEIVGVYVWRSAVLGSIVGFFQKPFNLIFAVVLIVLVGVAIKLIGNIVREKKKLKAPDEGSEDKH